MPIYCGTRVEATTWHDALHPPQFVRDIDPAPTAFRCGKLPDPGFPHVAIVGTRRASAIGREIARELGAGLAEAGVVVVSGLALGIDAAAHHGALLAGSTPPVAVVGSGCDVRYPKANAALWGQIASRGRRARRGADGSAPPNHGVFRPGIGSSSRCPTSLSWSSPDRPVVRSSPSTRPFGAGVDVMAVPGSLRNGAAQGANRLLADGCAPVLDARDIIEALGLDRCGAAARRAGEPAQAAPSDAAALVLDAIDDGPTSIDELVDRTQIDAAAVFAALTELELGGRITHDGARVRRC